MKKNTPHRHARAGGHPAPRESHAADAARWIGFASLTGPAFAGMTAMLALFFISPAIACEDGADSAKVMHVTVKTATGPVRLHTEVAATPKARQTGLMNRQAIGTQDGMLFLFPSAKPQSFWMKNTHIALDILFIDAEGKIVKIAANATPESETPIPSDAPVQAVLEIAAGRAAKTGMHEGDAVAYAVPNALHVQ